jgi:hypothetical protein
MMTQDEYDFCTGKWSNKSGTAFNKLFNFCRSFGWVAGLDEERRPVLTGKGIKAVKYYVK